MKTKILTVLILVGIIATSCEYDSIRPSESITVKEVSYSNYNALSVSDDFNVYVTFSDTKEEIEIEANRNLQSHIVVKKDGNRLIVKMEDNLLVRGNETLNVYITTREITDFEVRGDSRILIENSLDAQSASIYLSGDSYFTGEVFVDDLKIEAKGDSDIDVFGSAGLLYVDLRGDSTLKNYDLEVEDLLIDLRGDSDAFLTVSETIDIDASGDSVLRYKGDADVTHSHLTGDSKIIRKD